MGNKHRLGVLEVRATGHDGIPSSSGLVDKGIDEVQHQPSDVPGLVTQVKANERRDLIIAGATRTQASTELSASALNEASLEGRVDILIPRPRTESTGDNVGLEGVQRLTHPSELGAVEQTGGVQSARVGARARDVVASEAEIKVRGDAQRSQGVGRSALKAASP